MYDNHRKSDVSPAAVEIRDVKLRLHVLEHKVDAILSKLDNFADDRVGVKDRLHAIDNRHTLILEQLLGLNKDLVNIAILYRRLRECVEENLINILDALKISDGLLRTLASDSGDSWEDVAWSVEYMHNDIRRAVTELTNVSWDEISESNEPHYKQDEKLEEVQEELQDLIDQGSSTIKSWQLEELLDNIARNSW